MNELLLEPADLRLESTITPERIECVGICHNGPIDGSARAIRNAAEHDPQAPAAFLLVCPGCDRQLALCEKKVDSLLESSLLGNGFMRCSRCPEHVRIDSAQLIRLNQG